MIFTACAKCDAPLIVPYEAGEPGAGMFDRRVCQACGAPSFVQLVSIGGVTLSESEAVRRGLVKARATGEQG